MQMGNFEASRLGMVFRGSMVVFIRRHWIVSS